MRVLFLTQYFPPEVGAAQTRLDAITSELARSGHEVTVVTAMPSYPIGRVMPAYRHRLRTRERRRDVEIRRVWALPATGMGLRRALSFVSFAVAAMVPVWRLRRPDLVFVESPPPTVMIPAAVAALRWRSPIVLYVADLWPDSAEATTADLGRIGTRAVRRFMRWAMDRSQFVTAATVGMGDLMLARGDVTATRLAHLPNGVDTTVFRPRPPDWNLAASLRISEGTPVVLYAGTIGYVHGVGTAIRAMCELAESRPDVVLVVVGGGSEATRIQELASQLRLGNVRFVPPVPEAELGRYWSIATIGLSTLRDLPIAEMTRPVKVFASMASEVPVLYSGSGEGARLVVEAEAGVVTPAEDPTALADAIVRLVADRELAAQLGANGRRYAEAHLSWEQLVDRWLSELHEKGLLDGA